MIYCFLYHVSCFIYVSSLNLLAFYALCHVSCLDLYPYMLICLDLYALCYMPLFPMLCSSFCSRMMLGLHAYMLVWCYWLWYAWIYVSMCLFPCYMVRSLSSHVCMLGFMFFQAFILTSICLDVHLHAYMHISMLTCVDRCVYMLRSMFSTWFMPSSMCLRALCHVYVLRPRPCLSRHVLL